MDKSYDAAVSALLLGYSTLSKTQRDAFMERLNQFTYVSPQKQRRIASDWLRSCEESANPAVRMIAETAATYVVHEKKKNK
jgi:hypothetical protein